MVSSAQEKQSEWFEQWSLLQDDHHEFLFEEWISPYTINDFKDKDVLECGCGGGQHTSLIASVAKSVTAVDLNTISLAKEKNKNFEHVTFIESDIANLKLNNQFDIVLCIGVLQHTSNSDVIVRTMKAHLKPGGLLLIWCYSKEGNFLIRKVVEPIRKAVLTGLTRKKLLKLSKVITALMYIPIYTIYLLPIKTLPYFEYFQNFRKLTFYRNVLNVFDKLNAPQTIFFDQKTVTHFVSDLSDVKVLPYKGVSWRISGRQPC